MFVRIIYVHVFLLAQTTHPSTTDYYVDAADDTAPDNQNGKTNFWLFILGCSHIHALHRS